MKRFMGRVELHRPLYAHRDCFPEVDNHMVDFVSKKKFFNDIKKALFSMKPWKAPGVDGIQAGFFNIIGTWWVPIFVLRCLEF